MTLLQTITCRAMAIIFFILTQASPVSGTILKDETRRNSQGVEVFADGGNPTDSLLRFADYLFENHDYEQAVSEYRRYLFATDTNGKSFVRERIVDGLTRIQKFNEAKREASRSDNKDEQRTFLGKIYYHSNQLDSSLYMLSQVRDTSFIREARKYLGLSLARSFRFTEAADYISFPARKVKHRSTFLAGALSIIPGLGQIYSGRWGDGAYAITIIGTGAAASLYYHRHDEDLKFSLVTAATSVFYIANIYSAAIAAKNYDLVQNYSYYKEIEERVLEEE